MKKLTRKLGAVAIGIFWSTTHAYATGEIYCKAADGRSGEIFMNVGRLPVLNILNAEVNAFDKSWATHESAENRIIVGQAFENKTQMMADFTDDNAENVLISIRTVRDSTTDEFGEAGLLRIGKAIYPVVCESG